MDNYPQIRNAQPPHIALRHEPTPANREDTMSYYPPEPTPPPAKKRHRWPWIVLGAVFVVVVIAIASNGGKSGTSPASPPAASSSTTQAAVAVATTQAAAVHTVVYAVSGHGKLTDVTYTTDGMASQNQETNASLPWSKTITLPANGSFEEATIVAQGGSASSSITVTITVDGKLAKTASATGYGVADANTVISSS